MKETVGIRTDEIPGIETRILAQTLLSAVNAFYSDPQNVLKFEEWKKKHGRAESGGEQEAHSYGGF